jgi:hypothetical protein
LTNLSLNDFSNKEIPTITYKIFPAVLLRECGGKNGMEVVATLPVTIYTGIVRCDFHRLLVSTGFAYFAI